jgi:hypothetical protein
VFRLKLIYLQLPKNLPSFPMEDYLKALHNRRSPAQQEKYLSLCNTAKSEDGFFSGISTTNRGMVRFGEGEADGYLGVFAVICHANHRCVDCNRCTSFD